MLPRCLACLGSAVQFFAVASHVAGAVGAAPAAVFRCSSALGRSFFPTGLSLLLLPFVKSVLENEITSEYNHFMLYFLIRYGRPVLLFLVPIIVAEANPMVLGLCLQFEAAYNAVPREKSLPRFTLKKLVERLHIHEPAQHVQALLGYR